MGPCRGAVRADAKPYEQIKMRVLNAAQSTLSHQGALVGHEFSFEAARDPILSALTQRMLERETASTLPNVSGMEIDQYIETSLARIRNRAIRHRCHQIGTMDRRRSFSGWWIPLRERLAAGQSADLLTLSIASWMSYCLAGSARFGRRWVPSDPWAQRVIAIGDESADFDEAATAILGITAIFGSDLVSTRRHKRGGERFERSARGRCSRLPYRAASRPLGRHCECERSNPGALRQRPLDRFGAALLAMTIEPMLP